MEPRARAARLKTSLNFGNDLGQLLFATGAPSHPDLLDSSRHPDSSYYLNNLPTPNKDHTPTSFDRPFPETIRVLDEIVTDFIIETCHGAVQHATYSGRTKLKYADFEWVIRRDSLKLGRVQEMFRKRRAMEKDRRLFDEGGKAGVEGKLGVGDMIAMGEAVGEEGTGKGKGRGRGRRKKRVLAELEASTATGTDGNSQPGHAARDEKLGGDTLSPDGELDDAEGEPATKRVRTEAG